MEYDERPTVIRRAFVIGGAGSDELLDVLAVSSREETETMGGELRDRHETAGGVITTGVTVKRWVHGAPPVD